MRKHLKLIRYPVARSQAYFADILLGTLVNRKQDSDLLEKREMEMWIRTHLHRIFGKIAF